MFVIPVIRVGNSRGLRIPRKMLDAIVAPTQVQLDIQDRALIIRPLTTPRLGWDSAAKWANTTLNDEDDAWLNADLADLADDDGSEVAKSRSCVVVSPDEMNAHLSTVIVAPLTSTVKGWPSRVLAQFAGIDGEIALDQLCAAE